MREQEAMLLLLLTSPLLTPTTDATLGCCFLLLLFPLCAQQLTIWQVSCHCWA